MSGGLTRLQEVDGIFGFRSISEPFRGVSRDLRRSQGCLRRVSEYDGVFQKGFRGISVHSGGNQVRTLSSESFLNLLKQIFNSSEISL